MGAIALAVASLLGFKRPVTSSATIDTRMRFLYISLHCMGGPGGASGRTRSSTTGPTRGFPSAAEAESGADVLDLGLDLVGAVDLAANAVDGLGVDRRDHGLELGLDLGLVESAGLLEALCE